MKTNTWKSWFNSHLPRIAALACCLACFFISAQSSVAGFVGPDNPGTNYYNIYAYESASTSTYGHDPEAPNYYGGNALSAWVYLLPQTGLTAFPISASAYMPGTSSSFIIANLANNPTGTGLILSLTNPHTTPDEVRFDWAGTYHHVGSPDTIPNYTIVCSGSITGSGYWEVASGETIEDETTFATYTASTAYAPINGTPYLFGPAGSGPWVGANTAGPFSQIFNVPFSSVPTISGSDGVLVWGYIDVIVDPGTIQIQIGVPPGLGIGLYSNSPVVYFPSNPGTNYTLQMTTNLATGPWVAVTNGVPFTAVQITNAPSPAFFRLQ